MPYDVVIVGTGAGGGTLLHSLASTGKRILVLERGEHLPREQDNWSSRAVFVENRYKADEAWRDGRDRPLRPEIHYWVGGNTKLYGAALLRFRERDFEELRHHDGISPAWPIRYSDLAPYYTRAERLYHVHGQRGMDPTEAAGDDPYPFPPLLHEPRIEELRDDLVRLGLRPFPLPMGVMRDERTPATSACVRCATCDGHPCMVDAKADAETVCVRPALRWPNVTLLTGAKVVRLVASASRREITEVVAERDGRTEVFAGDLVVVACGAINSAALLLRSGLANRSDTVGRFYMCHNNSAFVAISARENPTVFQKTLALNDYYFGADDFGFPLGHVQTMGKADAEKFGVAAPMFVPQAVLRGIARRSVDFWLTSEDLPDAGNRVELARDGGIRLRHRPNNLAAHDGLVARLKRVLAQVERRHTRLPVLCLRKKVPLSGTTHQCGTLRFGDDPRSSVLDVNCKAHDVDNLYVVDGSFFPSSAALNPALTIIANALRVGDHLRERLGCPRESISHALPGRTPAPSAP